MSDDLKEWGPGLWGPPLRDSEPKSGGTGHQQFIPSQRAAALA